MMKKKNGRKWKKKQKSKRNEQNICTKKNRSKLKNNVFWKSKEEKKGKQKNKSVHRNKPSIKLRLRKFWQNNNVKSS